MIYTTQSPISLNQIAANLTIGGAAYGLALANINGYGDANAALPIGTTVNIPDDWLGASNAPPNVPYVPGTNTPLQSTGAVWLVSFAVLATILLFSKHGR